MKSLAFSSIKELKERLARKEISAQELLQYTIARFEKHNRSLGAALEVFDQESITASSIHEGILGGIPGIIKDNICQEGRIASCASRILEHYRAPYDATVSARLKKEGALLVARANMDEFAMGSSTETSAYFKGHNPWNLECVPGGSSGGSIAAVAAGLVPWGLGTETGGSVRQPAAFCGIVGMKPTYGLVSRYGVVAYASSTDQVSPATRTVYDNALVLSAIAGNDNRDSSTLPVGRIDYTRNLTPTLPEGLRIGIIDNALNAEGVEPEVKQAIEDAISMYEKMGATVKRIRINSMDYAAACYFIISRAEAASNLARFDGVRYGLREEMVNSLGEMYEKTRRAGFGKEVRARILVGNYVLSAGHAGEFYTNAQKVRHVMRQDIVDALAFNDVLLMPTAPAPAFKIGAFEHNKLQMDLQDYFTCPVSLTGHPAISIPCGFSSSGMPLGMQLVGRELQEELLYRVAYAYESNTQWHTMHPPLFND
jgi:aspartyl-tRNA(Asn)/glutamyl-tRNA(Gln) amidotransferase subunit A